MKKALIIVESPAKIKTLKKFLGSDYLFESSIGHIRDLPPKKFGIDLRYSEFSALVRAGLMSRNDALKNIQKEQISKSFVEVF